VENATKNKKTEETFEVKNWVNKPVEDTSGVQLGIKEGHDGYWITKNTRDGEKTSKLSNWTGTLEAVIVRGDDERDRKITIKHNNHIKVAFMDSDVLTNVQRFRAFLLNNCDSTCLFEGNENDLQKLVEFWGKNSEPIIIKESECVGEIPEGFISDNVFVAHDGTTHEISSGLAYTSKKQAIQVAKYVSKAGKIAGMPIFLLNEPMGGIDKFKEKVFDLMIKNRNLKVAIALGWLKATLWSNSFYRQKKWFPLFMTHGRRECGKSVLARWLLSILGLSEAPEISIRKSQYEAGSERAIAYYSSLPVHFCDYRNTEHEGQKFHALFRNIFDRSSVTKGKKNSPLEVRQVVVRGCLMLDGENSPTDAGLNSRFITFELTEQERVEKYYKELVKLEPTFNYIGMDWIKHRNRDFKLFMDKYNEIDEILKKSISSGRQAQSWAVALASILTEPYFKQNEEKLVQYAVRLAGSEIKEQNGEETISKLWEAIGVLKMVKDIKEDTICFKPECNQILIHIPSILAELKGDSRTRDYQFPNRREITKLLKQEKYFLEDKLCRVGYNVDRRYIFDFKSEFLPDILKNMYASQAENEPQNDDI
jgi:hypothetical protein